MIKSIRLWRDFDRSSQMQDRSLGLFDIACLDLTQKSIQTAKNAIFVVWSNRSQGLPSLECFVEGKKHSLVCVLTHNTIIATLDFLDRPIQLLAYRSKLPDFLPKAPPKGLRHMETFIVPFFGYATGCFFDGFVAHLSGGGIVEGMLPPGGPSWIELPWRQALDEGSQKLEQAESSVVKFWNRCVQGVYSNSPSQIEIYRQSLVSILRKRYRWVNKETGLIWIYVSEFSQHECLGILLILQAFSHRNFALASEANLDSWGKFWKRFSMALACQRAKRSLMPNDMIATEISSQISEGSFQQLFDHLNSVSQILSGSEKTRN